MKAAINSITNLVDKYLSGINRTGNCWNRFGNSQFEMYLRISVLCHSFSCSQKLKIFESRNEPPWKQWDSRSTHEKIFGSTHEKIFGNTKYSQEKDLDPSNTHEKKFRTNKIPTRKNIEPTKQSQKHKRTRIKRPVMVRDRQNLAHSSFSKVSFLRAKNLLV